MDEHAIVFHVPFDDTNSVFIFEGKYPVSLVDQVNFCFSEATENSGILTTYHPRPNDHHALRKIFHLLDTFAGHHYFFIDGKFSKVPGPAACGEYDVVGPNSFLACSGRDFNFVLVDEVSFSFLVFKKVPGTVFQMPHLLLQKIFAHLDGPHHLAMDLRISYVRRLDIIPLQTCIER